MHFIISWDIPTVTQNRDTYVNQLIECFKNYPYMKPLNTFYVVKVPSQIEHTNISNALIAVGKTIPGIRFLISPIMSGGTYNGLLQADEWTKINEITG